MAADNNNLYPTKEEQEAEDRKKDLPQFSGVVQVKRAKGDGFLSWICRLLFSGRSPKEIAKEVIINDVAPSIQDGLYNTGVSLLGKTIYRENQGPGKGGTVPGSFVMTNYVNYADRNKQKAAAIEASKQSEEETVKSGFENPAFTSYKAAEDFLNGIKGYCQKYDKISVHDLAWMQKKTIDYTWEKYGWEKEEIMAIREPSRFVPPMTVDDGKGNKIRLTHYIDLPKAHVV